MIETHCHLEMDAFDNDREEVIRRARDAGLEAIITIGSDLKGCRGAVELSQAYDFVYAAVGIHPHDAKDFNDEAFNQIKMWVSMSQSEGTAGSDYDKDVALPAPDTCHTLSIPKIVALGEMGLDYHYDLSPREVQREVFKEQLAYAKETGLPAVIHSREAKSDTLRILEDSGVRKGVMHCFSGDVDMAKRAMAMGFHISLAGPVTFKNARRLHEIACMIPDEMLLIETDAPYLAPEPFRGKRNEPAYIIHTVETLAMLRGVSPADIKRITTINAKQFFGIGTLPGGKIAYKIRDNLYLNITNRCTNRCTFCVRFHTDYVKGHNLRLHGEPTEEELKEAVGDPARFKEIVFCGYGEPLLRFNMIKSLASWIKQRGGRVRINTNGHGNLIYERNILPELQGLIDAVSVSLNAHDEETYQKVCKPLSGNAFREVLEFTREATKYIPSVQMTVVDMNGVDISKCREIADSLGIKLRIRTLNSVG